MQPDQLQKTLRDLLVRVQSDTLMDDDDKASLIDLINEVVADPTPENLEALALVLEELGNAQEYTVAKETISNYESQLSENEQEEPASASTQ